MFLSDQFNFSASWSAWGKWYETAERSMRVRECVNPNGIEPKGLECLKGDDAEIIKRNEKLKFTTL